MAGVPVKKLTAARGGGEITIQLQCLNALPLEGVMSTLDQRTIQPTPRSDPTIVTWHLPLEEERYVLYGIVTPLEDVGLVRIQYKRSVLQAGRLLSSRAPNPERFDARKLSASEWLGTPEVIGIKIR
jgi:hypothetical protein